MTHTISKERKRGDRYTIPEGTQRHEDRWDEKVRIRAFLNKELIARSERLAKAG